LLRRPLGVGLSLAIAAEAARLLGAELRVESQLGVGSVFRIALCHAPRAAAGHENGGDKN
jgi:signal transduction histidine kinase